MTAAARAVQVRPLRDGLDLLALKRAAPSEFPLLLESAAQGGKARWDLLLAGGGSGLFLGADEILAANIDVTEEGVAIVTYPMTAEFRQT